MIFVSTITGSPTNAEALYVLLCSTLCRLLSLILLMQIGILKYSALVLIVFIMFMKKKEKTNIPLVFRKPSKQRQA